MITNRLVRILVISKSREVLQLSAVRGAIFYAGMLKDR